MTSNGKATMPSGPLGQSNQPGQPGQPGSSPTPAAPTQYGIREKERPDPRSSKRFTYLDWIQGPLDEWGWGYVWGYRRAQYHYMQRMEKAIFGKNRYYGFKLQPSQPGSGQQSPSPGAGSPLPPSPDSGVGAGLPQRTTPRSRSPSPTPKTGGEVQIQVGMK